MVSDCRDGTGQCDHSRADAAGGARRGARRAPAQPRRLHERLRRMRPLEARPAGDDRGGRWPCTRATWPSAGSGRDGCDYSLLSPSEAAALAAAERLRNYTACAEGPRLLRSLPPDAGRGRRRFRDAASRLQGAGSRDATLAACGVVSTAGRCRCRTSAPLGEVAEPANRRPERAREENESHEGTPASRSPAGPSHRREGDGQGRHHHPRHGQGEAHGGQGAGRGQRQGARERDEARRST